jgi:chromosome segregation ATPase
LKYGLVFTAIIHLGVTMPVIIIVALSALGFFALMAVTSKLVDRKKSTSASNDGRVMNPKSDKDSATLMQRKTELKERIHTLANQEKILINSIQEFEQRINARKTKTLADEQVEIKVAVTEKIAAEARVHELRGTEQALAETIAALQDDVVDLSQTKDALDESITTLLTHQREIEAKITDLDRDIDEQRKEKMKEMEKAVAAQKELALSKIMAWAESEKSRLQERFENSYQSELTDLRRQLIEKVSMEFDSIHEYFLSFASERKLMAEAEIKNFLEEKRSTILSNLE